MATDAAVPLVLPRPTSRPVVDKGLRRGAIGPFASAVIGLASTAPAYSLAASVSSLADGSGVYSAGVVLAAAVPMVLVALAFRELNAREPDAGATFSWVTRAFGARAGWLGGWIVVATCLLVMGALANVAAQYALLLVGADGLAGNRLVTAVGGSLFILVLTWLCSLGVTLTARTQTVLLVGEVTVIAVFSVVSLTKVLTGDAPSGAAPQLTWLNPLGAGWGPMTTGLLLAVFLYWGWDTSFSVNEETEQPTRYPGLAALIAVGVLAISLVLVTVAVIAWAGPANVGSKGGDDVFAAFGQEVLGGVGGKALVVAVMFSAIACTQTTILPTARTLLSMGTFGALPPHFARVSDETQSPIFATWTVGVASVVIFLAFIAVSQDALDDSVAATALGICAYYGGTAVAVPWYFRGELTGPRNMLMRVVLPLLGAASMFALMIGSAVSLADPREASTTIGGVGTPLVVALGVLALGGVLLVCVQRSCGPFFLTDRMCAATSEFDIAD